MTTVLTIISSVVKIDFYKCNCLYIKMGWYTDFIIYVKTSKGFDVVKFKEFLTQDTIDRIYKRTGCSIDSWCGVGNLRCTELPEDGFYNYKITTTTKGGWYTELEFLVEALKEFSENVLFINGAYDIEGFEYDPITLLVHRYFWKPDQYEEPPARIIWQKDSPNVYMSILIDD